MNPCPRVEVVSHPDPRKKKILNSRYDLIIGPTLLPSQVFSHVGEKKIAIWCQIRRIWRTGQPFEGHSHVQQPLQPQTCVQEHCHGSPFGNFPGRLRKVSGTTFQNPELLMQCRGRIQDFHLGGGGGGGGAKKKLCARTHIIYERGTELTIGRGPGAV